MLWGRPANRTNIDVVGFEAADSQFGARRPGNRAPGRRAVASPPGSFIHGLPEVVADQDGAAVAFWKQNDHVWAASFTPPETWSSAIRVDPAGTDEVWDVVGAVALSGATVLVWASGLPPEQTVWAARFLSGRGWEAPRALPGGLGGRNVQIAIAPDGGAVAAVAVWTISYEIWASVPLSDQGP